MAKLLGKTGFHAKYHLAACHGGVGKSCCTFPRLLLHRKKKIKSSLYSRLYAETCNEWWSPSPWLSTWTTQLRRNIAAVVSCWRHCIRFDRPGNRTRPPASIATSLITKPTARFFMEVALHQCWLAVSFTDIRSLHNFCWSWFSNLPR